MHKEILISIDPQEKRVAILEDKKLEEHYVERTDHIRLAGNIYKGVVKSIVPGIGAAFVDIGLEKNGFLYVSDIAKDISELEEADIEEKPSPKARGHHPDIQGLLKKEQQIMVQVVKEPFRGKGARLSAHISLPGRFIVLMPQDERIGMSKKITDGEERARLKNILTHITVPPRTGFILRTVAVGAKRQNIVRDLKYLLNLWHRIKIRYSKSNMPTLLHGELDLTLRTLRDYLRNDIDDVIVDSKEEYRKILQFLNAISPAFKSKVKLYRQDVPLFEGKDVEQQIEKIYHRKVYLKSGGHIVIEPTESLVAIDVNSGKFVGKKSPEETAFATNIEAAAEIARQIRLRDLGGIIIIDFIDMVNASHRKKVFEVLEAALKRDRAKTSVETISELGLIEMTRQRMRRSLESVSYQQCPYCQGRGSVKSALTVSISVLRMIKKAFYKDRKRNVEIHAHPDVASRLLDEDKVAISKLQRSYNGTVIVKPDPYLHIEDVRIFTT